MRPNWEFSAKVVHSVPERGWGLAEAGDKAKKIIFLHISKRITLNLRGSELLISPADPREITVPPVGTEIVVGGITTPEAGGNYPQASEWATLAQAQAMKEAREKAAATLARLAAENAKKEAMRQEAILNSIRRSSGTLGRKKRNKQAHAST